MVNPSNPALWSRVKAEAKRKFSVWPSAYASGWLTKEYKRRGGKFRTSPHGKSPSGKSPRRSNSPLSRWYKEKWVNVCKWPKRSPCGRSSASPSSAKLSSASPSSGSYPYCRPSVRVSSSTPKTVQELSKEERKRRCSKKRRSPHKILRS